MPEPVGSSSQAVAPRPSLARPPAGQASARIGSDGLALTPGARTPPPTAQDFLPADFPAAYGDAQRQDMLRGASRIAATPAYQVMLAKLHPGDLVVVKGGDPLVAHLTDSPWSHAAICVSIDPPVLVEAVGMTGDHADQVRRSPFSEFIGDNPGNASFEIVRPCPDPGDPEQAATIRSAIQFAEAQVGKPYDFSGIGNRKGNDAWYCSDLIWAAYDRNPAIHGQPLAIDGKGKPERDGRLAMLRQVAKEAGLGDAQLPLLNPFIRMVAEHKPDSQLVDYLVDQLLPAMPSGSPLGDLVRAPGGKQAAHRLLIDAMAGEFEKPELGLSDLRHPSKLLHPIGHDLDLLGTALHSLGLRGLLLLRDAGKWANLAVQAGQAATGHVPPKADVELLPADIARGQNARWVFDPATTPRSRTADPRAGR